MQGARRMAMSNKTEVKPEEPTTTPGAATSVEHIAPEDHYASGGQHQEQKDVLKKSVDQRQPQPPAGQNAGQHSTGSFTGTTDRQEKKP
jgi:hypothetical protein